MKLPPNRLSEFLRKPSPEFRAVLFYGPDAGLVRERGDRAAAAICPDLKDPFRIAELTVPALAADPARLADEIAAMSLVGGRRVIRIRDAGDGLAAVLAPVLAGGKGDGFLVVEAGDLPARSSLRKLCEAARDVAVGACYADGGRDIAEIVREMLRAHNVAVSGEAVSYLVAHLGNDRQVTRSELEKLALYAGDGGRVELADAVACIGDSTALSLDDVIFAATDGDPARLEGSLLRCLQEGQSAVGILRAMMRHFQRLHLAASRIASGASADEAMRILRPPIFFKQQDRFRAQLEAWPVGRAASALELLTRAELNSKRAALPQETVLREALFSIARAARRGSQAPI